MTRSRHHHVAESARLWHLPSPDGLPMMWAAYRTHAFPRHMHPTFMIEIVESGVDEFECRGAVHRASAGRLLVINPFEVHTGRPGDGGVLAYRSLYPSVTLMAHLAGADETGRLPVFPTNVIADRPLADALLCAHRRAEESPASPAVADALATLLQDLIRRHAVLQPVSRCERSAIARTRAYILEHFRERIPLDFLADVAGMSTFHFARTFTHDVGLPPHEYLINVRVERAKRPLAAGEEIAQVARRMGFADQSHFGRCFRRIVGCTPGRYSQSKIVLDPPSRGLVGFS
jgi:AraC-like DNA-binding protein